MLRSLFASTVLLGSVALPATASDLDLKVSSQGSSSVVAAPGSQISIEVTVELCDANNLGLAGFFADLSYDGGALTPFAEPTVQPLANFASPLGLANPAGFGGTLSGGDLLQVGGAQNTINQGFAPMPSGAVVLTVAHPGSPETVGSGTIQVPDAPGVYTVTAVRSGATAIKQTATGVPFWEVEPADVVVTPLTITVEPTLTIDGASISLASGGTLNFGLDAGAANAGRLHVMLGSVTGTSPALNFGGLEIPLVLDAYTLFTLNQPTSPPIVGGFGLLDGAGQNTASFTLPAATDPALAGFTLHHAYVLVLPAVDFASNAVSFTLNP
ncbi:MAG: hypothetical protein ACYSWX_01625 [Planctomycetota bacterium]|jgi:hypothetical protein